MSKLLKKPKEQPNPEQERRYQRFGLVENPFPTEPVNKDSTDSRINGNIYESEIRTKEYEQVLRVFLAHPQVDLNRLRMGYICDTSYIGRGNGKSAFLVNLLHSINSGYCMEESGELNKCFGLYVVPEPGGRTKSFSSFVDSIFFSMLQTKIIETCLATLRLEVMAGQSRTCALETEIENDEQLIERLNTESWYVEHEINSEALLDEICKNDYLQELPKDFPLFAGRDTLYKPFVTVEHFENYYKTVLKRGRERFDFVFSHLVRFFLAAGFNGAYILVDDFERIPDFQSGRQRKDFAIELRSCLLDGPYENARFGFYTMLLVLHAGVPNLISEAWSSSGLENRYPIARKGTAGHWIPFDKLNKEHVFLLLKKYLDSYRVDGQRCGDLTPFSPDAIERVANANEYNAGKILRTCWDLPEKAAEDPNRILIDLAFVNAELQTQEGERVNEGPTIEDPDAVDLLKKAKEQ